MKKKSKAGKSKARAQQVMAVTARTAKQKFHEVRESILLISEGIAQNSPSGYWEHPNQFVGSGLHRRRLRYLPEC